MQLRASLAFALAFAFAFAFAFAPVADARAEGRAALSVDYFLEPAARQRLHIVHPQLNIHVDAVRAWSINLGYAADVVTGATQRTYGRPAGNLDVVSQATDFFDARHAFHVGNELRIGPTQLDVGYTFAFENDYRSHALDVGARVDLWGKNTSFRLGYSHNFDEVCNADNRGREPLERQALATSNGCFDDKTQGIRIDPIAIDSYALSWTQVLTPILLFDAAVGLQVIDGFQSNPYRRVRLFNGTVEAQEAHPLLRQRLSAQVRFRVAIKKARAAIGVLARYYDDTWGVRSGTAELSWEQYLAPQFLIRLRGRFYQQSRAVFYRDAGESRSYEAVGPVGQYFTGDRELSPFRDWLVGIKLSYIKSADERGKIGRVFEALDVNLKTDLIHYEPLTPLPPNVARTEVFIGALIIQLGIVLRW